MAAEIEEELARRALWTAMRAGSYKAARQVAIGWHGGADHNITGLSHGREWSSYWLIEEISQLLSREKHRTDAEGNLNRQELEAFRYWTVQHTDISSVDSAQGHHFLHTDATSSCLLCGGEWEQVHTSATHVNHGRYRARNGAEPTECTGPEVSHEDAESCNCHLH